MTDTPKPLDLLDALEHNTGKDSRYTEEWQRAYNGLRAFLSSDLIQKLQDPKLRAAVEVLVDELDAMTRCANTGGMCNACAEVIKRAHRASQAAQATEKGK